MSINKQSRFDGHIDYKKYGPGPGQYDSEQKVDRKIMKPKYSNNYWSNQLKEMNKQKINKPSEIQPGPGHYNSQINIKKNNIVKNIFYGQKKRFDYDKNLDEVLQNRINQQEQLILQMSQLSEMEERKQELKKVYNNNNYYFIPKQESSNNIFNNKDKFQQQKENIHNFKMLSEMNLIQRSNFNNIANQIIDCYNLKEQEEEQVESKIKKKNGRIVFNYQVIQPYLQQKVQQKINEKKKQEINLPGPGCYDVITNQASLNHVSNLAGVIMRSESLRYFQKQPQIQTLTTGPGSYNTTLPNKKKNFNYNFKKDWL